MTIRSVINSKKRKIDTMAFSIVVILFAGVWLIPKIEHELVVIFLFTFLGLGVVVAVGLMVYSSAVIRCPKCNKAWPVGRKPFSISKKMKLCPYCGVDVDSELDERR